MPAIATICVALLILATLRILVGKKAGDGHWQEVPGPKRRSWLTGNRRVIPEQEREAEPDALLREYSEQYGPTFIFPDVLGQDKLYTSDPVAMLFVTSDIDTFVLEPTIVALIKLISGGGLVAAFGHTHRRMRRALSPSFSILQLKKASEIVRGKAVLLARRMGEAADRHGADDDFNCCPLLDSAALDTIAEAGFGYRVNALEDGIDKCLLAKTYTKTVQAALGGRLTMLIMIGISHIISPAFVSLPLTQTNRVIWQQKGVIDRIASDIIAGKKASFKGLDQGTINDELGSERDILSSIVRNNLVSPPGVALSDEELVGQVQTFLFAGFETTATTFAWCLWHLARDQPLQERVRACIVDFMAEEQLTSVGEMGYEQIWDPRLDLIGRVLSETLRMHPPVHIIERVAGKATILPTSAKNASGIVINKGDKITLGVSSFNFQEKYYGKNVHNFNPDRWMDLPVENERAKLPQYGSMNFSSGPKACIGSKFALTEMRAFLIEMLSRLRFEPSSHNIVTRQALVLRPTMVTEEGVSVPALPLKVTRLA